MDAQARADRAAEQAAQRLAATIRGINTRSVQVRSSGLVIPTLDADPPATDPTVAWRFEDGRLRVRRADGGIDEFVPTADAAANVLSLSSNSAADSAGLQVYRHSTTDELRVKRPDGTWAAYASTTGTGGSDGGGGNQGGGTSNQPAPDDPSVVEFTDAYPMTWARAICPTHGPETQDGDKLYFGDSGTGTHGLRKIMIGLDDAQIQSDLAGATIRDCWLRVATSHTYYNGGAELRFGGHNKTNPQAEFSSSRERVFTGGWPKTGGRTWRQIPLWFGRKLRDGEIRGLTLNQQTSSIGYYGAIDAAGFELRIKATKET